MTPAPSLDRGLRTALRTAMLAGALALAAACGAGDSAGPSDPPPPGDGNHGEGPSDPGTPSTPGTPGTPGGAADRSWTVMVFMAADNNLSVAGIQDLDEIEAAGTDGKVQVVVQAEFSPSALGQYNCDASCFNRPNFNTFRYAVGATAGQPVAGPDGPVTDIGNRDMTDPAQLREFVQWAKATYPARHYALVLWNHGGGYTGLLQDETSAGSSPMSLSALRSALGAIGGLDLLDFDMCLMGGYETLAELAGAVDYAVFSEEVVPGEGNPYKEILTALRSNPSADPRTVAQLIADRFHASYQGNRASTTVSAYDLTGYAGFESALGALADQLRGNLADLRPAIADAASRSQKYAVPELTDLGDFLDSLRARVTDPAVLGAIDALEGRAGGSFRLASHARTGSAADASNVDRSTGLSIVLPSGVGEDRLADEGPRSLGAYQALYAGKAWTEFLAAYVEGQASTAQTDQGDHRFQSYLVWDSAAVSHDADVDLWVLEPSGNVYIPAIGSVTPNGTLSNDSYADQTNFESYVTNRFVQNGTYKLYANLWRDPQGLSPYYDLAYRSDTTSTFAWLNGENARNLSLDRSWMNDETPSLEEVEEGAYTDLQLVGYLTFGGTAAASVARSGSPVAMSASVARVPGPRITPEQVATIRRLVRERRAAPQAPRAAAPALRAFGPGGAR